jgi:hypothetical protein
MVCTARATVFTPDNPPLILITNKQRSLSKEILFHTGVPEIIIGLSAILKPEFKYFATKPQDYRRFRRLMTGAVLGLTCAAGPVNYRVQWFSCGNHRTMDRQEVISGISLRCAGQAGA